MQLLAWKIRLLEYWRYGLPARKAHHLAGPVVLMYHGVVNQIRDAELHRWSITTNEFVRHLDYLRRHYDVISLPHAVEAVSQGQTLVDTVVLTFDDAFANVYETARPLLRVRNLPYTVAVPVGLVGANDTLWCIEVSLILLRTRLPALELPLSSGVKLYPLHTRQQRLEAIHMLFADLRQASHRDRQERIDMLRRQLPEGTARELIGDFRDCRIMSIDQLRELRSEGVTLAAHGYWHVPLHADESNEVVDREINGARATLEEMLGGRVDYFIYPYGVHSASIEKRLQAAGYRAAFTTRHGCLYPPATLMSLPRIAAECSLTHLKSRLAYCSPRSLPVRNGCVEARSPLGIQNDS